MRHIRIKSEPSDEWQKKAQTVIAKLKNAKDSEERGKIIAANGKLWGELKVWLLSHSHQKCWFSETKFCFTYPEVEHYRPKRLAKEENGDIAIQDGYWWLAFDWKNFRICASVGNRTKSTFFPLRDGCARTEPWGDTRYEDPMLLDPVDEDDPILLSFNLEGRAITAPHVRDEWERTRVECTVKRYNLDFGPLMERRKLIWAECWNRLKQYVHELENYQKNRNDVVAKQGSKAAMNRVRDLIDEREELSAVARACIHNFDDARVRAILQ